MERVYGMLPMDGIDWLNVQIMNCRLGTHPKGGHSASISNGPVHPS